MKRLYDATAVILFILVLPIALPIAGLLWAWFFQSMVFFASIMPWPTGWAPLQ